ncbi:MAG: hypothetical protein LBS63_01755 [Prevotellaceae bacterium]|jgi:hypothetical protein|nr:hypothetical protein [Prevotellaceae bacterium]
MKQAVSIEEIKKRYPDEWVLLGNPVEDESGLTVFAGVPLYHSRDKREVCYSGKSLTAGYDTITLLYNETTPRPKRRVLLGPFKRVSQ